MFINTAWAQAAADAPKPAFWEQMFPFFVIFIVFYFFIIRPQSKQRKQHAELLKGLKRGDQVITAAGIFGSIDGLTEKFITLEVDQGVKIKILRNQVLGLANAKEEQK